MKSILTTNIPDSIYRGFKSKAALDGLSVREAALRAFEKYGKGEK